MRQMIQIPKFNNYLMPFKTDAALEKTFGNNSLYD